MIKMEIAVHDADEMVLLTQFIAGLAELRRKQEMLMPKVLGGMNPEMQAGRALFGAINQTTMKGTSR